MTSETKRVILRKREDDRSGATGVLLRGQFYPFNVAVELPSDLLPQLRKRGLIRTKTKEKSHGTGD